MIGYPVILNADHLEFELEYKDIPLNERPDWPLPSFRAPDWARAFLKLNPDCGICEDVMISWFANALMRGYDQRVSEETRRDRDDAYQRATSEPLGSGHEG